ncbi:MAG: GNAT family N-acetyltransferase [Bdellovibrionales bacterium]|nr:GNAT family N-acetyltransferase [Bdellovibrionales bacterium]
MLDLFIVLIWFFVTSLVLPSDSLGAEICHVQLGGALNLSRSENIEQLKLATACCQLRPVDPDSDLNFMIKLFGNPKVRRMSGDRLDADRVKVIFRRGQRTLASALSVRDLAIDFVIEVDNELVGSIQLVRADLQAIYDYEIGRPSETWFSIGYSLMPEVWGRGYGTQVVDRVLQFAFDHLNATGVHASVLKKNAASRNILKKLEFSGFPTADRKHDHFFRRP